MVLTNSTDRLERLKFGLKQRTSIFVESLRISNGFDGFMEKQRPISIRRIQLLLTETYQIFLRPFHFSSPFVTILLKYFSLSARYILPSNCYVTVLSKLDLSYLISRDSDQGSRKRKKTHTHTHKTPLAFFCRDSAHFEIPHCSVASYVAVDCSPCLPVFRYGSCQLRIFFYRSFLQPDKIPFVNAHYAARRTT